MCGTVVLCVAFGLRGFGTLIGFGLGAMAAATAGARAACSRCGAPRPGTPAGGAAWSAGPTAAWWSTSASCCWPSASSPPRPTDTQAELALRQGAVVTYDGHTFEFEGLHTVTSPSRTAQEALVKVDGAVFTPATTSFGGALSEVGTPAIDSGFSGDIYLTFDEVGGLGATSGSSAIPNLPADSVAIGVVIEPLVAWLWAGGCSSGSGACSPCSRVAGAGPPIRFRPRRPWCPTPRRRTTRRSRASARRRPSESAS